ncbi:zinc finger X-linked protein ZXDB-like [Schistocerca gregaria]|uniref:zinc finger X-linked protein ZXDB-like n=1 Tax=Schistocerca gregaria TaxID=7010 RepID=UPI00211EFDB5|nr:zinc finger X-linked protein ZXDB-like [Schistocerca gregaria]
MLSLKFFIGRQLSSFMLILWVSSTCGAETPGGAAGKWPRRGTSARLSTAPDYELSIGAVGRGAALLRRGVHRNAALRRPGAPTGARRGRSVPGAGRGGGGGGGGRASARDAPDRPARAQLDRRHVHRTDTAPPDTLSLGRRHRRLRLPRRRASPSAIPRDSPSPVPTDRTRPSADRPAPAAAAAAGAAPSCPEEFGLSIGSGSITPSFAGSSQRSSSYSKTSTHMDNITVYGALEAL